MNYDAYSHIPMYVPLRPQSISGVARVEDVVHTAKKPCAIKAASSKETVSIKKPSKREETQSSSDWKELEEERSQEENGRWNS